MLALPLSTIYPLILTSFYPLRTNYSQILTPFNLSGSPDLNSIYTL